MGLGTWDLGLGMMERLNRKTCYTSHVASPIDTPFALATALRISDNTHIAGWVAGKN